MDAEHRRQPSRSLSHNRRFPQRSSPSRAHFVAENHRALDRCGPFRNSTLTMGKGATETGFSESDSTVLGGYLFDWHSGYFRVLSTAGLVLRSSEQPLAGKASSHCYERECSHEPWHRM